MDITKTRLGRVDQPLREQLTRIMTWRGGVNYGAGGIDERQSLQRQGQLVGPVEVARVVKTDAQWREQLTPEQFQIARGKGTERPFCGTCWTISARGLRLCLLRAAAVLVGWQVQLRHRLAQLLPARGEENVITHEDRSYGMVRTEILCARCDGHLGHVFDDGPPPRACATASTPSRSRSRDDRMCRSWLTPLPKPQAGGRRRAASAGGARCRPPRSCPSRSRKPGRACGR